MAQARKRFVVDENGRKESVLLPIGEYEDLLEDLEDLALMVERKDEATEPLEDVAKRLEKKWKSTESS